MLSNNELTEMLSNNELTGMLVTIIMLLHMHTVGNNLRKLSSLGSWKTVVVTQIRQMYAASYDFPFPLLINYVQLAYINYPSPTMQKRSVLTKLIGKGRVTYVSFTNRKIFYKPQTLTIEVTKYLWDHCPSRWAESRQKNYQIKYFK